MFNLTLTFISLPSLSLTLLFYLPLLSLISPSHASLLFTSPSCCTPSFHPFIPLSHSHIHIHLPRFTFLSLSVYASVPLPHLTFSFPSVLLLTTSARHYPQPTVLPYVSLPCLTLPNPSVPFPYPPAPLSFITFLPLSSYSRSPPSPHFDAPYPHPHPLTLMCPHSPSRLPIQLSYCTIPSLALTLPSLSVTLTFLSLISLSHSILSLTLWFLAAPDLPL